MPNYKYKALAPDGSTLNGVIVAFDEFEAIDKIKQTADIVTSIVEVDDINKKGLSLNMTIGTPKISEKTLSLMCSQFSIVLKAGMPIAQSVQMISTQTADKELKRILAQVAEDVATGHSLARSFESKGGKQLPVSFIETIRAGEESGTLETSFAKLKVYFEKSEKIRSKVKSAMLYPIFLLVLATIAVAIILIFAMPVFVDVFETAGTELPGPTKFLIALSDFLTKSWFIWLAVILLIIIGTKYFQKTEKGRMLFAEAELKLPVLGHLAKMKASSQLANTLSTLLSSGLPIVRSVLICSRTLDNYYLSTQLGQTVVGLEEGKPLGDCLEKIDCFPAMLVEMTAIGEQTGSLEATLDTIGEYYDAETETSSARALTVLQQSITIVMGLVIGFIVVALYLPMFNLYQ